MATTQIKTRVKNRRDTAASWASQDPVLYAGELAVETRQGQSPRLKVGDGSSAYSRLPYVCQTETSALCALAMSKSTAFVDGQAVPELSAIHISREDYARLVVDGKVLSNAIYVVSGDYVDAYGQQIRNVADGVSSTDAATYGQLASGLSGKLDLSGGTVTGELKVFMDGPDGNDRLMVGSGSDNYVGFCSDSLVRAFNGNHYQQIIQEKNGVVALTSDIVNALSSYKTYDQTKTSLSADGYVLSSRLVAGHALSADVTAADISAAIGLSSKADVSAAELTECSGWSIVNTPLTPEQKAAFLAESEDAALSDYAVTVRGDSTFSLYVGEYFAASLSLSADGLSLQYDMGSGTAGGIWGPHGATVAVREPRGYVLGSQTGKQLASEAEAEALRAALRAELDGKADRVAGPTAGNFAALDVQGNLVDSGVASADIPRVFYGTCSTAAATEIKAVSCAQFANADLAAGTVLNVRFSNASTSTAVQLKVNGGTAKRAYAYGTSNMPTYAWYPNQVVQFVFDGTYWMFNAPASASTTYQGTVKLVNSYTSTSTTAALVPASLNNALTANVNPTAFSTAVDYAVGDFVYYNSRTYECTAAHPAGAWNAGHFALTTVGNELNKKASKAYVDQNSSKVFVDGDPVSALSVVHISQEDYEQLVVDGETLSAAVYVVSGDYVDVYGQQIKNLSAATDLSDAVTYGQLLSGLGGLQPAGNYLTAVPSSYKTYNDTVTALTGTSGFKTYQQTKTSLSADGYVFMTRKVAGRALSADVTVAQLSAALGLGNMVSKSGGEMTPTFAAGSIPSGKVVFGSDAGGPYIGMAYGQNAAMIRPSGIELNNKNVALAADLRYSLTTKTISNSAVALDDRACSYVDARTLGSSDSLDVDFPARVDGKARDFVLALECGANPPAISYAALVTIMAEDASSLAPEEGMNIYSFTEFKANMFIAARKLISTVVNNSPESGDQLMLAMQKRGIDTTGITDFGGVKTALGLSDTDTPQDAVDAIMN